MHAVRTERLAIRCMELPYVIMALLVAFTFGFKAVANPPVDGRVLWLRADLGVTPDFTGGIVEWQDQSGNGLHAGPLSIDYGPEGTEGPMLVEDAVNGHPAVRFDGIDDVLQIASNPLLQPAFGSWTVAVVARRLDVSTGDFPQIIGSRPWFSGNDMGWAVSFDTTGRLASHYADGNVGHDVPQVRSVSSLSQEEFEMWFVEEDFDAGRTRFFRQGDLDADLVTAMPVDGVFPFDPVHIGREIGGSNNRRAHMELAEVLIYNRVLGEADRLALTQYLSDRYDFGFDSNMSPQVAITSPLGGESVEAPGELVLEVEADDVDGSVARVEFYGNGARIGVATAPPYRLALQLPVSGIMNFHAIAFDDRGASTRTEDVSVTVTGEVVGEIPATDDLVLWLRADAGVTSDFSGLTWNDQSGAGNHALQWNTFEAPEWLADAGNGRPAFRFDGVDDYLEIANAPSLQPGSGSWNVIIVGRRRTGSMGDFPQVIGSRPWGAGADLGWAVAYRGSDGFLSSHYADGSTGHDVPQVLASSPLSMDDFEVWQVEEDRPARETRFYRDGGLNAARSVVMPSGPLLQDSLVHIGREIGGANNRRASMDLAEVLIYPRVLSDEERAALHSALAGRYGKVLAVNANVAPEVALLEPAANSEWELDQPVLIEASASDVDGSVVLVEVLAAGQVLASWTTPPYTLQTSTLPLGELNLVVRATDNLGGVTVSDGTPIAVRLPATVTPMQLIGEVDYSDSFTVGPSGDPTAENPRPSGMYNNDSFDGYTIENSFGNPSVKWTPTTSFSFNLPNNSTGTAITLAALGNPGADTGLAQSGGGDFNIAYGLRESYVVEVEAILPLDRLDIGTYQAPGDGIGAAGALTVFFRRDGGSNAGIGLYNGSVETAVALSDGTPARTGVIDNDWHRFAVHFDRVSGRLGFYVDGILKAGVDLATFGDGAYQTFSNGAVGVGGAGFNGTHAQWFDNFAVGAPTLVGVADYSDTFTVGAAGAPTEENPRPNGMYNNDTFGGYFIENSYGKPLVRWTPTSNFSFNVPGNSTGPDITLAALGNPGADTGIAQSGGGDFSIAYGLRESYVVEVDAILPWDRLNIGTYGAPGDGIAASNSLTVFLRRDDTSATKIALHNGSVETELVGPEGTPATTGVVDYNWHRFAVHFDQAGGQLAVFVDGALRGVADLTTFADGAYANFANGAVGVGGAGFDGTHAQWFDNFVVGQPGPGALPSTPSQPTARFTSVLLDENLLIIEWDGAAVLESAPSVDGPWEPVVGASSPYTVEPLGSMTVYRLAD